MNQALEIQNNQIIFDRAAAVFKMQHGSLTEDMIDYLRKLILKPSWKIEAKYFRLNRDNLGLSQNEVAESLNISVADLRKLERSVDFADRDILASQLKNYLQLQIN
jgi:DNA-binding transcriptional regulator YiaG